MARVNVETRALGEHRFATLAEDLSMARYQAIGMLVIFWHDSQERGVWRGSKERIMKFIPLQKSERSECFDALLENEYITRFEGSEEDEFVIHGNRKHIEALEERKEAAAEGGRAKARKINQNKESLAHGRDPLPPAKSPLPNSIQSSTKQSNAVQSNSIQKRKERAPSASVIPPLGDIWNKHKGQLSELRGCSGKRLDSAKARWDENPSTEYWAEIITRMALSDFCLGKKNQPGPHASWKADFDFLIRPDTQHKVLEGKYDNRSGAGGEYVSPEALEIRRQMAEEDKKNGHVESRAKNY